MPLPTLNWRRLSPVAIAATNVNAMLDALYTAGTAATYADGSARTPGTGSAWTWSRDTTNPLQAGATTAAYASPPLSTALNQRIIWAGSTAAPTALPVLNAGGVSDTSAANVVYCSVAKNAGAYSNWNSATPFTSGQFLGFARSSVAMASASWTNVSMWESQEAVAVQWTRVAPNSTTSINMCGAFMDPGATANGESDGRLYGITTTGSNNYTSTLFWSSTAEAVFYDSALADRARFAAFVPGAATTIRYIRFGDATPAATFLSRNGDIPLLPWWCINSPGNNPARLREIVLTRDILTGRTLQNGGVAKGYSLGANNAGSDADACVLLY